VNQMRPAVITASSRISPKRIPMTNSHHMLGSV
jgi:hypothetical protein